MGSVEEILDTIIIGAKGQSFGLKVEEMKPIWRANVNFQSFSYSCTDFGIERHDTKLSSTALFSSQSLLQHQASRLFILELIQIFSVRYFCNNQLRFLQSLLEVEFPPCSMCSFIRALYIVSPCTACILKLRNSIIACLDGGRKEGKWKRVE